MQNYRQTDIQRIKKWLLFGKEHLHNENQQSILTTSREITFRHPKGRTVKHMDRQTELSSTFVVTMWNVFIRLSIQIKLIVTFFFTDQDGFWLFFYHFPHFQSRQMLVAQPLVLIYACYLIATQEHLSLHPYL